MADSEGDSVEEENNDYFAILNVRKEATEEELKAAYRRMCVLYHPDKHQDPDKKKTALQLFSKIQTAYQVLSNPESRAIYEIYGQKGLDAGWEIIERRRTPAEIQAEYERLQREKEERRLQQRTNPRGTISVGVDATDLFDNYEDLIEDRMLPNIEVSNMLIAQSIEAPLTRVDTATLAGSLKIRNGNGSGNIALSLRRVISHQAWGEAEFGAGEGPNITFRAFRNLTKRSYGTAALSLTAHNNMLAAGLTMMAARQLDKHTIGYLTWKTGLHSSMNTMIVRETEHSRTVVNLQLGIANTFCMTSFVKKVNKDTKVKGVVKFGVFGMILDYGCERQISEHSVLGATMSIGSMSGVTLKIKLTRSTQVYSFPISLSEEVNPSAVFYGTVVPLAVYWAVKMLVVSPFLQREKEKEAEANKEKHAEKIAERKKEAEESIRLMQEAYERIVQYERSRHGLFIVNASYGHLVSVRESSQSSNVHTNHVIDVTVPVQCQVKESRLFLTEANKHNLSGFYDPCPGQEKMLTIRYEFRDALHEVTVEDNEPVKIPLQSHRIDRL